MSQAFFNCIIDKMFTETNFNYNSLNEIFLNNEEYDNEIIKLFFLGLIHEFNPDEIRNILENRDIQNSNLNLIFKENVQNIFNEVNIDVSFNTILFQSINTQNSEFMRIIYSIVCFCCKFKSKDFILSLKEVIQILLFEFFDHSLLNLSLQSIKKTVKELSFFTIEEISHLIEKNRNDSIHLVVILYYIFKRSSIQNNLSDDVEIFQELYYCKFDLIYLYHDLFLNKQLQNIELENMFVLFLSSLNQFFTDYNIDNNDLYSNLVYLNQVDLLDQFFLNTNFTVEEWNKIYYNNPYKVAISTLKILSKNSEIQFNFYDFETIYLNISDNYKKNNNTYCIFIKCLITLYIIFTNDIKKYGDLIESDNNKLLKNVVLFHTKLVILTFKIKKEHEKIYPLFKTDLLHLLNDIFLHYDIIFVSLISNNKLFDEELIEFIINNVESGHMSSKYFEKIFNEYIKDHTRFLNSFILFGYWINKYPLKEFFTKAKDFFFIFQRTIDLKNLFDSEENVNKFVRGVFLIFKAFPIASDDTKQFLNFLKKESDSLTNKNNYSLINHTKEKIEKLCKFINKEIFKNEKYKNKNTNFVDLIV